MEIKVSRDKNTDGISVCMYAVFIFKCINIKKKARSHTR